MRSKEKLLLRNVQLRQAVCVQMLLLKVAQFFPKVAKTVAKEGIT